MKISVKQVDAFTEIPLTGNPAGVVLKADGLSDRQMQMIAREMSVPETAFILPPSIPGADLRIRWFTPTVEVPLCGHATVASFHALAEDNMYGMELPGSYTFRLETKSGILPVEVTKNPDETDVLFGLTLPECGAVQARHHADSQHHARGIREPDAHRCGELPVCPHPAPAHDLFDEAQLLCDVAIPQQPEPERPVCVHDGDGG
jgi:PhzF family phenazine biosynthesis protein